MSVFRGMFISAVVFTTFAISTDACAATFRALPLPPEFTIAPEAQHRLMTIGTDETVYGVASRITDTYHTRAVRWSSDGASASFISLPQQNDETYPVWAPFVDVAVPWMDEALVTVGRAYDGAHGGTAFITERWANGKTNPWPLPACVKAGFASSHVYAVDHQRIGLTMDPSSNSPGIDPGVPQALEENLPRAIIVEGTHCTLVGKGILTGLRGRRAVGYIGYINGTPYPWYLNSTEQHAVAFTWMDGYRHDLGPGVPFATRSRGVVVGSTSFPGIIMSPSSGYELDPNGDYPLAVPHAVLWSPDGKQSRLFAGDGRSVAWDINDMGIIVGMMQSADGRHFAFR